MQYTYLALNILTLLGPLALSFDKKVAFWKSWKALWPAIAVAAAVFLIWDVIFTEAGVWGFNPDYLIGWYFLGLPLEEWLFFLTIPYACTFIYACVKAYFPRLEGKSVRRFWAILGICLMMVLPLGGGIYTQITFMLLTGLLFFNAFGPRTPHGAQFLLAYLISLVPFLLVNGVLTALPVVWYNDAENLGIRLFTIPIEDTMYCLLLLLMTANIYDWGLRKQARPNNDPLADVFVSKELEA